MKIFSRIKFVALLSLLIIPTSIFTASANTTMPSSIDLTSGKTFLYESIEMQTKSQFSGVIVDYKQSGSLDDKIDFQIRFKDGFSYTEWVSVNPEIDTKAESIEKSYLVNTNLTDSYQYKISLKSGIDTTPLKFSNLKFTFINAKGQFSEEDNGVQVAASKNLGTKLISRASWGAVDTYNYSDTKPESNLSDSDKSSASANDPEIEKIVDMEKGKYLLWPYEYMKDVKMIVIHHTASTTDLDDSKQAIRNIQYYHAVRRGWGDIGYNYIMDQKGNLYEGRIGGEKVVGGHAIPVNKASIGIAVIGNFETQKVPKAVTTGLVAFIQEKAQLYGLKVNKTVKHDGKSYPVVGGHRDNSATACPGENLYDMIPNIIKLAGSGVNIKTSKSSTPTVDLDYLDTDPLRDSIEIKPGETKTIKIVLENTGKKSWTKESTYISVYDREIFKDYVVFDNLDANTLSIGNLKESSVASGKKGTFEIKMTGGIKSGYLPLNVRGVINGSIKSKSPILLPISVEEADFSYKITKNSEIKLKPGEEKKVQIKIQNTGNIVWNSYEQKVKVGVSNPKDLNPVIAIKNPLQTPGRIDFLTDSTVKPKGYVTFELKLKAPKTHTNKVLTESYSLVMDGVSWFKGDPIKVTVNYETKNLISNSNNSNVVLASNSNSKNLDLGLNTRIHISKFKNSKATLKAGGAGQVVIDGKAVGTVSTNDKIVFEQNSSNVSVTFNKKAFLGKIASFAPDKVETVSEITDFNNPPAWNQNLNDNQYRSNFEFRVIDGTLYFINELPLEIYIKGLGEVSDSDPTDKIKTIMVAARSYAHYYTTKGVKFKDKPYNLDDDPNKTQKYIGYGLEKRSPNISKAVDATKGEIITYNKKTVVIPYFSQSDGKTRSAKEVWNWTDAPYLNSVSDKFCATPTKLLGHGVGISGCGATGMAKEGYNYKDIIKYFLKGVEITQI